MDLNKTMLIGRITQDPELKTTPTGQSVASFSLATNWTDQTGQKQERVEFHNIVAWRRLGEICGQYLRKGSKVYIEGHLETRNWTAQDGTKRYRTEIIANNMIMLDSKGGGAAPMPGNTPGFTSSAQGQAPTQNFSPTAPRQAAPQINNEPPTISQEDPVKEPMSGEANPQEDDIKVEDIPF